jgi:hypothetical protein
MNLFIFIAEAQPIFGASQSSASREQNKINAVYFLCRDAAYLRLQALSNPTQSNTILIHPPLCPFRMNTFTSTLAISIAFLRQSNDLSIIVLSYRVKIPSR